MVKVKFVAKEGIDRFGIWAAPGFVTLEMMRCEFDVYITPQYSSSPTDQLGSTCPAA